MTNTRPRSAPGNKTQIWLVGLAIVVTLGLTLALLTWVSAPTMNSRAPEDTPDLNLAATQPPPRMTEKRFPAGLGTGQIQLIDTRFPVGLGTGQIQLIGLNGPYLGMSLSATSGGAGAYVNSLIQGSPGEKAGIQTGDVLLALDGVALNAPEDVGRVLSGKQAGASIKVVFTRAGVKQSTHIVLTNAPFGIEVGQTQDTPWLGADVQDIDAIMGVQFNLPDTKGVIVSYVAPNSPAAAAGLAVGDVIRRVAQTRVRDVAQFQTIIAKNKPGQRLRLTAMRAGTPMELDVALGLKPPAQQRVPYLPPADVAIEATWIGMDLQELGAGAIAARGLPTGTRGILAIDVDGPPATTVGFQNGDVLLAINNVPTPDMRTFMLATQQLNGAAVEVLRSGKHIFISTPPPGFTAQGAQLKTGLDRKFRQVAFGQPGRVAALVADKSVNAQISGEAKAQAVVLVDLGQNAYVIVELRPSAPLPDLLQQNGVTALLCSDLSAPTAAALNARGIAIYPGVVGSVLDSLALYRQKGLAPVANQ